jgi:flagellar assembly protein FliH
MASSSDWFGARAGADPANGESAAPGWLALLGEGGAFRQALPFAGADIPAPEPAPEPPAPDPLAEACARAHAEGVAAGRAAAMAEAEERAGRQRALRLAFRTLDEAALAVLVEDLAATVAALCEAVLADAASDRSGLLARCEAAARRIGGAPDALALHLHPDDIALLGADGLAGWRIVPDAGIERGGVLIEGPEGTVSDGPAEWRRAIAAAVRG